MIIMHNEGWSIHELPRQFQIGRNTVRRILRAHDNMRDNGHDVLKKKLKRASKLDDFAPEIKKLLEKYPGITVVEHIRGTEGTRDIRSGMSILKGNGWRNNAASNERTCHTV